MALAANTARTTTSIRKRSVGTRGDQHAEQPAGQKCRATGKKQAPPTRYRRHRRPRRYILDTAPRRRPTPRRTASAISPPTAGPMKTAAMMLKKTKNPQERIGQQANQRTKWQRDHRRNQRIARHCVVVNRLLRINALSAAVADRGTHRTLKNKWVYRNDCTEASSRDQDDWRSAM